MPREVPTIISRLGGRPFEAWHFGAVEYLELFASRNGLGSRPRADPDRLNVCGLYMFLFVLPYVEEVFDLETRMALAGCLTLLRQVFSSLCKDSIL